MTPDRWSRSPPHPSSTLRPPSSSRRTSKGSAEGAPAGVENGSFPTGSGEDPPCPSGRSRAPSPVTATASACAVRVSRGGTAERADGSPTTFPVKTIDSKPTGMAWANGSNPTGRKPQFLATFHPPGSAVRASQRMNSASPSSFAQRKPRRRVATPFTLAP